MGLWDYIEGIYTLDKELKTHRCNQTDLRNIQEQSTITRQESVERQWGKAYCLDNPEEIQLMIDVTSDNKKSLWLEAYICKWEGCKSAEEIQEFMEQKYFYFGIITNTKRYQPNKYGD